MDEARMKKYNALWQQREQINREMADILHENTQMDVQDYELQDWDGNTLNLSDCFGDHDKLVLIHNMGRHCNYCTIWRQTPLKPSAHSVQ